MGATSERQQAEKGLSARHLIWLFLGLVAVCAVFFSLGFLVGYNERTSKAALVVEHVTSPDVIPPMVSPPETAPSATEGVANHPAATSRAQASASKSGSLPLPVPAALSVASGEVSAGFVVQVAALRTEQDGEALAKLLKTRGYKVFILTPEDAHAGDALFRVQVGPFTSRDDAEKVRQELTQEGFMPFIRH